MKIILKRELLSIVLNSNIIKFMTFFLNKLNCCNINHLCVHQTSLTRHFVFIETPEQRQNVSGRAFGVLFLFLSKIVCTIFWNCSENVVFNYFHLINELTNNVFSSLK